MTKVALWCPCDTRDTSDESPHVAVDAKMQASVQPRQRRRLRHGGRGLYVQMAFLRNTST